MAAAASRPENLTRFCGKHGLCGSSAVISTRLNGHKVWRLITGNFPDRLSAQEAARRLPAHLRALKPWP